ncbi:HIT domain-containing protein [Pararhizobium sp. IMCC21322]|uniref:HIT domain-containing protein n=1 Tax=Pararhizobium sp. IMCC21322 TaxID=3067903 RepID=UPI0027421A69|nr:HIT family protein [Pararhizobium sp. IMCC21322]
MKLHPPAEFQLDPRLEADTHFVASLSLCDVLLMNDNRFPWLILVPRLTEATEIVDLDEAQKSTLWQEVDQASRELRALTSCDKLNIGALGNMVRQLHIHVIGRYAADAAWPGPVWGKGTAVPYEDIAAKAVVNNFRSKF